jgi:hypothetical protein
LKFQAKRGLHVQEYKMEQLHNNPYSAHQDISLLLPWYVNKTLHGAEIKIVENHLKVCSTCTREIATLYKLAVAVQQEGSIDSAAHASFSQLKKRIQGTDETSQEKAPKVVAFPGQRQWYSKLCPEYFVLPRPALAMAAVLLLSLLIPRFFDTGIDTGNIQMNEYRTLSNAENPAVGQNTIRVIFSNDTKQPQINEILASVHGQIVGGPTAQGVYRVAIKSELAPHDVLGVVESLRKNTNVIFAEPPYALLSSAHANKDTKQ